MGSPRIAQGGTYPRVLSDTPTECVTQCANTPLLTITRHHANHALNRVRETKPDTTCTSGPLCYHKAVQGMFSLKYVIQTNWLYICCTFSRTYDVIDPTVATCFHLMLEKALHSLTCQCIQPRVYNSKDVQLQYLWFMHPTIWTVWCSDQQWIYQHRQAFATVFTQLRISIIAGE